MQSTSATSAAHIVHGLEAIIDAAAGVLAQKSLTATLDGMARALQPIVPFSSLAVYEADHEARLLVPVYAVGRWVEETLADRPGFDSSLSGAVVESGEMAHLDPWDTRLKRYTIPGTPDDEQEAIVIVPLVVGETVIGALTVWREDDRTAVVFSKDEAELIRRFATLAALAYANAQQREQLRVQALTDALTGLANRRMFQDRLKAELLRGVRDDQPVSLVVFDIDDFKAVNDRYGHPAGDAVLRNVAKIVADTARGSDIVCRVGGEEFAAILPATDADSAAIYAHRALAAVRDAQLGPHSVTASAGVAIATGDDSAEVLVRRADDCLLQAKRTGKDRVVVDARTC
jgi:diguanylate cyclase (GGDEF)-like protein